MNIQTSNSKIDLQRVFVRDLVLSGKVGAYPEEKDADQRVRFSVHADLHAFSEPVDDQLAKVFSYDGIVNAIRTILSDGHTNLLETLAERIADFCLAEPRVARVHVQIEKLDRVPGAVGVELTRHRRPLHQTSKSQTES